MHFGVALFLTEDTLRPGELARAAEERGFESLWLTEHSHIPASRQSAWPGGAELPREYYGLLDPFVSLACAAEATRSLRLGTGVCLVAQRDPIQTAKAVATLDVLLGGRFLFGVGGGWNREEMENHGTPYEARWKVLRERGHLSGRDALLRAHRRRSEAAAEAASADFVPRPFALAGGHPALGPFGARGSC